MSISSKWVFACALGSALLLGGAAGAAAQSAGGGGAPQMTPLTYRQGIMQHMQGNMGALTAVRSGQAGSPEHALARATILHQLGMMLGDVFPEGSASEESRALPAIWSNPAEYAQSVQAYQAATNALVEAARAGDAEQIATAQTAVQRACASCHMQFRAPAR